MPRSSKIGGVISARSSATQRCLQPQPRRQAATCQPACRHGTVMSATPSGVALSTDRVATPEQLAHIGKLASELVNDGDRVGLGSGRAALSFVRELGARVASGGLTITGVPTSLATEKLALELGITLAKLDEVEQIDIAVDGADEVAPGMALSKGGGGNLLREKITESIAKRLVIVVGEEKVVPRLGTNFPVFMEVIEFGRAAIMRALDGMGMRNGLVPRFHTESDHFTKPGSGQRL